MPYIEKSRRERIGFPRTNRKFTPGEMNYIIIALIHDQLIRWHGVSYTTLNEMIGMLECCKQELYRQIVARYEDAKRLENGPISNLDSLTLEDVR